MRIAARCALLLPFLSVIGCTKNADPASNAPSSTAGGGSTVPSGGSVEKLEIKDLKVGKGTPAKEHDTLSVTYTGSLKNGTVFDTNDKEGGKPFRFMLGAGSVIKGWDQGLIGVKKGGERKLSIPAKLAYGSQAQGEKIPANSDLYFDIKVNDVVTPEERDTIQRETVKQGAGPTLHKGDIAVVNYTLTADDGTVDDDKYAKKPYEFRVGAGKVLPAVDQAIVGLRVGGELMLTLPQMYGPHGPGYGGENYFKFDIKLLGIKH